MGVPAADDSNLGVGDGVQRHRPQQVLEALASSTVDKSIAQYTCLGDTVEQAWDDATRDKDTTAGQAAQGHRSSFRANDC
jgi:hypothetical protein